jgi:GTP-binding protein
MNMIIKEAKFVISSTNIEKCPKTKMPEYAFIGRSNVGKSSLINMLTNHKGLAKTSGKPGKTRLINHFIINNEWYMVDLPGYGFAQVSMVDKKKWEIFVRKYLTERENLFCVFVLIDIRLEPQKIDLDFMEWLGQLQIPFSMIFTKADKLEPGVITRSVEAYKQQMLKDWEELPEMFVTSAKSNEGRDLLLDYIEKINKSQ